MSRKLTTKDLINIGIFTAIDAVIVFTLGIITGFVPIIHIFMPAIAALVSGVIYMMFLTKVPKRGGIFIMSTILGILMMLVGSSWLVMATAVGSGLIAEIITGMGGYKSFKLNTLGFCFFSFWNTGTLLPFWVTRDIFLESLINSSGPEYAEAFASATPFWMLPTMYISAFLVAIVGAYIGKIVLKKHFSRAGIA